MNGYLKPINPEIHMKHINPETEFLRIGDPEKFFSKLLQQAA